MLTVKIDLNAPKRPRRGLALIRMWNTYYIFVLPSSFSVLFLWAHVFSFPAATPALLVTRRNGLLNKRVLTVSLNASGVPSKGKRVAQRDRLQVHQPVPISLFIFCASLSDFVCIKVLALNRKFLWATLIRLWLTLWKILWHTEKLKEYSELPYVLFVDSTVVNILASLQNHFRENCTPTQFRICLLKIRVFSHLGKILLLHLENSQQFSYII